MVFCSHPFAPSFTCTQQDPKRYLLLKFFWGGFLFISICDVAKVADCPKDDRAKFGYNVQGNGLKQGASLKQVLAQGLLKGCLL
jgi:hypothetical protein